MAHGARRAMSMTVVVTREVPDRYRGFLSSVMLELAPGVYTAPRMTKAVRERVWEVLCGWAGELTTGAWVLMSWPEHTLPGGQAVRTLGTPVRHLYDHEGIFLTRSVATAAEQRSLTIDSSPGERPPPRSGSPDEPA